MGDAWSMQRRHSGGMCNAVCKNTHRPGAPKAAHLPARDQGDKEAIIEPGAPELMAAGEKLASAPESGRECSSHATIQPTQGDAHNLDALPDCRRFSGSLRNTYKRYAQILPVNVGAKMFATNQCASALFDLDTDVGWNLSQTVTPKVDGLRSYPEGLGQFGRAAHVVDSGLNSRHAVILHM